MVLKVECLRCARNTTTEWRVAVRPAATLHSFHTTVESQSPPYRHCRKRILIKIESTEHCHSQILVLSFWFDLLFFFYLLKKEKKRKKKKRKRKKKKKADLFRQNTFREGSSSFKQSTSSATCSFKSATPVTACACLFPCFLRTSTRPHFCCHRWAFLRVFRGFILRRLRLISLGSLLLQICR